MELPGFWPVAWEGSRVRTGAGWAPSRGSPALDHNVLGGKACIRGMRISVSLIVNLVANRMTPAEIVSEYPSLEEEDVVQALRYAAWTSDDVFIPAEETA